jgi:L-asparaginase
MPTFVLHTRNTREVLGRVVSLLHRRFVNVESLTLRRGRKPDLLRIAVTLEADRDQAGRIEANLYRLVDVLMVERAGQDQGPGLEAAGETPESMKVIYVITTGGTIEKAYSEPTGAVANVDSKLEHYLRLLRLPGADVRVVPLLNKDSRELNDADRRQILGMVTALLTENAPIVITHGTDTMVQTGLYLQHAIGELEVPIVLTGAMVPLGFDGSDALQNLTESIFAARTVKQGIYVVVHGEVFPIYRVRKDHLAGRFVWTDENLM